MQQVVLIEILAVPAEQSCQAPWNDPPLAT